MALVPDAEVDAFLESHPEWSSNGGKISRTFVFADFSESIGFVTRVALEAEKVDHHPDIDIRWNKVAIVLSTHSENGLSARDLAMADAIDELIN